MSTSDGENRWVCPNDRVLTLRAKLRSGWSVKGNALSSGLRTNPATNSGISNSSSTSSNLSMASNSGNSKISDSEQQAILDVISRAQQLERTEKDRVERLMDRLNNMKRNATGTKGNSACALCNDKFHLFGAQCHICKDCQKAVCTKCGVDDTVKPDNETVWFCKICSETREMWKKSGAWLHGDIPTFTLSSSSANSSRKPSTQSTINCNSQSNCNQRDKEQIVQVHQQPPPPLTTPQSTPVVHIPTQSQYSLQPHMHAQAVNLHQNSVKVNSTRILSASPVMRKKSRSPSPRNHRNAFTYGTSEHGAAIEAQKQNDSCEEWDQSSTSSNHSDSLRQ